MMCEILIKCIDHTHPDNEKDRRGAYKRGDIVLVMEDGHTWGSEENPVTGTKFYILKIPGLEKLTLVDYTKSWYRRIQYSVVASNNSQDRHRIKIEATEFNANTGEGKITKAMAENFLTSWGGTVQSFGDNYVTFDITILNAIKTNKFWHGHYYNLGVAEINYEQGAGVHTIRVDYSGLPDMTPEKKENVKKWISARFNNLIHDPDEYVFTGDIHRSVVIDEFKSDIKWYLERPIVRRKFNFGTVVMNAIEAAGGVYTATQVEMMTYINNKMTE